MKTHFVACYLFRFLLFPTVFCIICMCIFSVFFDDKLSRVHWCKKLKWSDMLLKCLQRPNSKCPARSLSLPLSLPLFVCLSLSSQRLALALLFWDCMYLEDTKRSTLRALADTWASTFIVNFLGSSFRSLNCLCLSDCCCCCSVLCSCSVMNNNANVKSWKLICRARAAAAASD